MVKVTLEFPNVDVAIVELGKLSAFAKARRQAATTEPTAGAPDVRRAAEGESTAAQAATPAVVPAAPATRKRAARSDKGQPRGEYAPRAKDANPIAAGDGGGGEAVTDASKAAEQAANSTSTPATPSPAPIAAAPVAPAESAAAQASGVPAATYSDTDLQKKLAEVFAKGATLAIDVLSRFGVTRLANLKPAQHGEFVALCDSVLAGGKP